MNSINKDSRLLKNFAVVNNITTSVITTFHYTYLSYISLMLRLKAKTILTK